MNMKVLLLVFLSFGTLGYSLNEKDKDHFRAAFRATCEINDAEDKAPQAEAAFDGFYSCLSSVIEFNAVENELADARKNGQLKSFFKKYCDKSQQMKICINTLFDGLYPCMSNAVRGDLENSKASVADYIDSLCHNEAEKPISFFTGGVDCLKNYNMTPCLENEPKNISETGFINIYPFCKRLLYFLSCVTEGLEKCPSQVPLELTRALYYQLKNNTPCKDEKNFSLL